jgi:subtilase family serine protease
MATATAATTSRVSLVGTGYESDFGLTDVGPAATDTTITDNIYLSVRDPAALAAEAKSVSSPGGANYAKYQGRGQVQAENQLDPAQTAELRSWLSASGLTVSQPNWRELTVTGTIGQLAKAFDVTFDDYHDPDATDPDHYLIPTTDMSMPANLGKLVLYVGANAFARALPSQNAALAKKKGAAAAAAAAAAAKSSVNRPPKLGGITYPHVEASQASSSAANCSQYWGQSKATGLPSVDGSAPLNAVCGYTPAQLRHAYGLDSTPLTGKGQTVAVVTPSIDTLEQDVNTWSKNVGTAPLRPGQLTVVPTPDGSTPGSPSDDGAYVGFIENTMDVEAVHGMAPDADIVSVGISTAEGATLLESMAYTLDHTDASIVSMSVAAGVPGGMRQAFDQVYQEGALQGVGFYISSGDSGAFNPLPGSWATAVGGTSLAIGPDGSREWETGWGDEISPLSSDGTSWQAAQAGPGSSGGWLMGTPEPWYQRGVVPAGLEKGPDGKLDRVGPDISMDGDGTTGYLVGGTALGGSRTTDPSTWQYTQLAIGGTSLSSPLFAGVQALAQEANHGRALGFANPELYQRYGTSQIRDVTVYTLPRPAWEPRRLPTSSLSAVKADL